MNLPTRRTISALVIFAASLGIISILLVVQPKFANGLLDVQVPTLKWRLVAFFLFVLASLTLICRRWLAVMLNVTIAKTANDARLLFRDVRAAIHAEPNDVHSAVMLITLIGTALRLHFLTQPLRFDEALTVQDFGVRSLPYIATHYTQPNNHIFHSLLVHLSLLLGNSEPMIRLPVFISGCTAIPAFFVLARCFVPPLTALFGTALVAASSPLVEFSTNARGYMLQIMLFICAFIFANYGIQKRNYAASVFCVILLALGFYTIPTMLYPFGVLSLWLLAASWRQKPRNAALRYWLLLNFVTIGLTALLYFPIILVSGLGPLLNNPFVRSQSPAEFSAQVGPFLRNVWEQWTRDLPLSLSIGVVVILVAGLVLRQSKARLSNPFWAALIWSGGLLVVQRAIPFVRVWLYFVPLLALGIAIGADSLALFVKRSQLRQIVVKKGFLLSAMVVLAALLSLNVAVQNTVAQSQETGLALYARDAAALLAPVLRPTDGVLDRWDAVTRYYLNRDFAVPTNIVTSGEDLNARARIYILLEPENQLTTLMNDAQQRGTDWNLFTSPQIWHVESAFTIYVVDKQ